MLDVHSVFPYPDDARVKLRWNMSGEAWKRRDVAAEVGLIDVDWLRALSVYGQARLPSLGGRYVGLPPLCLPGHFV